MVANDADSCIHIERTGEDRDGTQDGSLAFREECVAPLQRREQGLLTTRSLLVRSNERGETIVKFLEDIRSTSACQAGRNKLDREGRSVEPPAYLGDGGRISVLNR